MFDTTLKSLWGFHPLQEAYYLEERNKNETVWPAKVTFASRDHFRVLVLGRDEEDHAKLRGSFHRAESEVPVVGDWVSVEVTDGDHQFLPIHSLLPRRTRLSRRDNQGRNQTMVANVSHVCIVTSFNKDLNARRIERALAMIQEGGAQPIVVLNKMDLVTPEQIEPLVKELGLRWPDLELIRCSAATTQGVEVLTSRFSRGDTVAFLGMSGVGKSTLINVLLEASRMTTSAIRVGDDRGRHTTTHRELTLSCQGFWLIDSPGIREFGVAGDVDSLDDAFQDISSLFAKCRFSNCKHDSEPGCHVRESLERGDLELDRWRNYLKIRRGVEYEEHRGDKAYWSNKRKENAKRSSNMHKWMKLRGR